MQNTIIAAAAGGLAVVGLNFGIGAVSIFEAVTSKPQPYAMQLKALHFNGGEIGQNIIVTGNQRVPAQWTAQITRNGKMICAGSGHFAYEPRDGTKVKWLTPSEWTGDECPPLQDGDVASAVWQYRNVYGFAERTSGELTITMPKGS